ncbi:MAG: putative 4-hydroxybenzoate polyprenyltransferase [Selenomonadaceae bacterium]|nr:putative 4-hydroxybenzoate polyprenyltransferase [Selenomonadaceae bacterium]
MLKFKAHAKNVALPHTIFSLPFALASAFMAADGHPDFRTVILILLAITSARWAAIAIDNLADLKYDKLQPRLSYRAMVRGEISKSEALIFILLCMIVLVVTVAQLPPICLKLLPVAAIPFIIYPFTKRFTSWCHLFLGVAIAMAPAGAWVAVTEKISLPPVILCVAVALWIGAFDAVYGAQDEKFDKSQKLHSLATRYGQAGALFIAKILHVISIVCFVTVGVLLKLGNLYFVGVFIAALALIYQHSIVRAGDYREVTQTYFMRNGIVSVAIFIFTWLSYD